MMKAANPIVMEMKSLVNEGITGVTEEGSPFPEFYQDLVQDYFKARKVEIDYDKEIVKVEIPVGQRYTQVNISCQPLEQFLGSCVKTDEESLQHYRKVLRKFEKVEVA